ncbi:MAG: glycerol-3-phosphate responsive antiterminator [Ktedonobacteraceae bacterium]|nr:glycerol-3-phosphate responsive antiterminator [Ktedonobacteraceae bacterium]
MLTQPGKLLWHPTARYKVIPVIESRAQFSLLLAQTDARSILLRHCNLFDLAASLEHAQRRDYEIYIDIDSCDGINSDEAGMRYLVEHLRASGIVSHHTRTLTLGKQQGLTTIQRVFAIDSTGLESEIEALDLQATDALNISPALVIPHIAGRLASSLPVPFVASGLVSSHEQVQAVLRAGALRVMTTYPELWS